MGASGSLLQPLKAGLCTRQTPIEVQDGKSEPLKSKVRKNGESANCRTPQHLSSSDFPHMEPGWGFEPSSWSTRQGGQRPGEE